MADNKGIGDKIDLGGKLPQFKAFALMAYNELNTNKLEWIRIADPNALILDDIQYATKSEIHACQVKWSNQEPPQTFTFLNLKELLKEIIASWQKLSVEYEAEHKPLVVHLLTNRPPSSHDDVKDSDGKRAGHFSAFVTEVWTKWKINAAIDPKWQKVADEFFAFTGLTNDEFAKFVSSFEINLHYDKIDFATERVDKGQRNEDLLTFTMFLLERVADKSKKTLFLASEIVRQLNWQPRFQTNFNHELAVDQSRYCPIKETLEAINEKVDSSTGGYVFLSGGPGSGKSSLLAQWSKTRSERVIHYYAFDFTNPGSPGNNPDRGEATNLFYDLVLQLKAHDIWPSNTILHKDKQFVKDIFYKQLDILGIDFKETGRRTIFIIDGLDHVPREYRTALQSFIAELPSPDALANGIVVVLGSQTFNLNDLPALVMDAYEKNDRNVVMTALTKTEVNWYIDHSKLSVAINAGVRKKLFEVSHGHPLYLSYLINVIDELSNTDFLEGELPLEGSIEDYYKKCWQPVKADADLVNFLGLVARINGDIITSFIKQWPFSDGIKLAFNKRTSFLFQKDIDGWHFFHNSFRQFLITQTALDPIEETFDVVRHQKFHQTLAQYYTDFETPTPWQKLFHFYMGGQDKEFLSATTQECFFEQFDAFRPHSEIEDDILRGVVLAKKLHDPYLLARYIFALNELNTRTQIITPSSFIEEFIKIGKTTVAKRLLRNNRTLLVTNRYALTAVHWFNDIGDVAEAKLLLALAEPQEVSMNGIKVQQIGYDNNNLQLLRNWASAAILFSTIEDLLKTLENVTFLDGENQKLDSNSLRNSLLYEAGKTLIIKNRPNELKILLPEIREDDFKFTRRLLSKAAMNARRDGNDEQARYYLQYLQVICDSIALGDFEKVELANLVYTISQNTLEVDKLINGIGQPPVVDYQKMAGDKDLSEFMDRILLNKVLNLTGRGQSILDAVPNVKNTAQQPVVVFERMLCLIVKVYTDGVQGIQLTGDLKFRLSPIIRHFYGMDERHDHNLYKLKRIMEAYFKLLIDAVAVYGKEKIDDLIKIFVDEFSQHPETWSTDVKRSVYLNGYKQDADRDLIIDKLKEIENEMLEGQDASGRADQSHLQTEAWIELGEYKLAEECMHKGLQSSLSIGYRKDSQYSIWVEWLSKILDADAEKAADRIRMFALHLPVFKETSERSYSREGAEALLKTTLGYNGSWGLQLFTWLLDKGLIAFYSGVGAMVEAMMNRATDESVVRIIIDIYCELYLYIATSFDESLLKSTLEKAWSVLPDFNSVELPNLIALVGINALPKTRDSYYKSIRLFLEAQGGDTSVLNGLTDLNVSATNEISSQNNLKLREPYNTLSEKEVLAKVQNGSSFLDLFLQEDKANSFFSWDRVFDSIRQTLSENDLREIFKHCNSGRRDSQLLAKMTERALSMGAIKLGKQFAESSLANSSPSGWIIGYDGGSRLVACKAIISTDPETGYDRALEVLADDVIESNYVSEFHKSFDDILPVLTKDPVNQKMWLEIESFLSRLLVAESGIALPMFKDASYDDVFGDFVLFLCRFQNKRMRGIMAKLVAKHLSQSSLLQTKIKLLAGGTDEEQTMFSEILSLLAVSNPDILEQIFENELKALAFTDNLLIRREVIRLFRYLPGEEVPPAIHKLLPTIYQLMMPVYKGFKTKTVLAGDEVVKDTKTLYELLENYAEWLPLLARQTGFDEGALLQRWGQLIREVGEEKTTTAYEEKIRADFKAIDLDFSFPRPRYQVVKQALARLVAELKDAVALNDPDFFEGYDLYDYSLQVKLEVSRRPDWLLPMQEGRTFLTGWVDDINKSARLHVNADRTADGWIVAGEYSKIYNLGWGKPEEIITTHLTLGGELMFDGFELPFARIENCLVEDYHNYALDISPYIIVFNDQDFRNPGYSARWIAFNPTLAKYLLWRPSDVELFGWEDESGEVMAFSKYWRDGNIEMTVPKFDNEVGEGWYTVISEKAFEQLKNLNSPFLSLRRRIGRELNYNGQFQSGSHDQLLDEWR